MREHTGALEQCLSRGDCQPQWPLNEALCGRGQRGGKAGSCWLHNKLFHNGHHLSVRGVNTLGRCVWSVFSCLFMVLSNHVYLMIHICSHSLRVSEVDVVF